MRKRILFVVIIITALGGLIGWKTMSQSQKTIEFLVGETPELSAKRAKISLTGQNSGGYMDFGYTGLPAGISGKYVGKEYEVEVGPLFAITFYADKNRPPHTVAHRVSLTLETDHLINTQANAHSAAQAYVQSVIEQFKKGKWQRYIPEDCPRLTGRSSLISSKEIKALVSDPLLSVGFDCSLDPDWKMSAEDWIFIMRSGNVYMWHGDGRTAKLSVSYTAYADETKPTYSIDLEFELEDARRYYDAKNRPEHIKDRGGPAVVAKDEAEHKRIQKILEENAVKRGDPLFVQN